MFVFCFLLAKQHVSVLLNYQDFACFYKKRDLDLGTRRIVLSFSEQNATHTQICF